MNKTVYVTSYMMPIYGEQKIEVPTGETKKSFWAGTKEVTRTEVQQVQTGTSTSRVDGERLSKDINDAITTLNTEGYEVVSVSMVTSGMFDWKYELKGNVSAGYGYGYGYSITEGAIIVAKRVTS